SSIVFFISFTVTCDSSKETSTWPESKSTSAVDTPANPFSAPSTDFLQWPQVIPSTLMDCVCIFCHFFLLVMCLKRTSLLTGITFQRMYLYYILTLFKRSEFVTTLTELNAIAAPAIQGASKPIAAIGIPALLYANAQNKF